MQPLLRVTRRHFSDKPMVKVIGLPLRYAELYELVRAITQRVLFDPTLFETHPPNKWVVSRQGPHFAPLNA
jgi:hypothetical protein